MPLSAVGPWLVERRPRSVDPVPTSLLGTYAGHLKVVETCRILMEQPLPVTWMEESKDPHACSIGRYFDLHGTHGTAYGLAHKAFHAVLALYAVDRESWQAGADEFRHALASEIRDRRASTLLGCRSPSAQAGSDDRGKPARERSRTPAAPHMLG